MISVQKAIASKWVALILLGAPIVAFVACARPAPEETDGTSSNLFGWGSSSSNDRYSTSGRYDTSAWIGQKCGKTDGSTDFGCQKYTYCCNPGFTQTEEEFACIKGKLQLCKDGAPVSDDEDSSTQDIYEKMPCTDNSECPSGFCNKAEYEDTGYCAP